MVTLLGNLLLLILDTRALLNMTRFEVDDKILLTFWTLELLVAPPVAEEGPGPNHSLVTLLAAVLPGVQVGLLLDFNLLKI